MLAISFFIVCVNIICTFLYLLFKREPKKKPVVEEKPKEPEYLEYSGIRSTNILELLFSKKDGTAEQFYIFGCRYWVDKDCIMLILPNLLIDRILSIYDSRQFSCYLRDGRRPPDRLSYDRLSRCCNEPNEISHVYVRGISDTSFYTGIGNEALCNARYIVSYARCITELEYFKYWEKDYN